MSEISNIIGQRIRNYRIQQELSQEKLAEISGCHPTYIGQLERGEKNATLETIEKIASALHITLSQLFEKIGESNNQDSIPLKCYEFMLDKTQNEQMQLFKILTEISNYKIK